MRISIAPSEIKLVLEVAISCAVEKHEIQSEALDLLLRNIENIEIVGSVLNLEQLLRLILSTLPCPFPT